ncbi:alanine--tRNA ligase [Candidatus Microgenomates bacterium]|nr:alanine--tRNA ligase [Candidatus Microgenomates bacterium]
MIKNMNHVELRKKYLEFWKNRNHAIIPSSSLVPENDPTTLFTGSGMQPMMPYLLGATHPLGTRLADSQKCFRAQDIEEIGDNRHTTMFEMLGNWSLGDYFKEEQINWVFEFLTKELYLDVKKLHFSVFEGDTNFPKDTETVSFYKKLGVKDSHIHFYGPKKNWWSRAGTPDEMPIGEPGGPDSEIFYEFTEVKHSPEFGENCHPNCDCGRFIEIGNSVFMTYLKTDKGFIPLKKKNIDFGGGFERMLAAVNNVPDIFKTDLYSKIISEIESILGKKYLDDQKTFRIIADHIKASVFLISDGVVPSNKMQGYFLRRLLRRSLVKARNSDFTKVCQAVFNTYEDTQYFKNTNKENVYKIVSDEQNKFAKTLEEGLKKINHVSPFDLYQTYGFPIEVTQELFTEMGKVLDKKTFDEQLKKHQELSRSSSEGMFKGGLADHSEIVTKYHTATHLLQAALRKILGDTVHQEGSNLTSERLRFDFNFARKITNDELKKIAELVNLQIEKGLEQKKETMTYEEALKSGAITFFKERYPEKVTVYTFGDFSKEICGGPHVENTKAIGKFEIIKEESVAAGIRRIYAKIY